MKGQKGITLVALVVTIIVLLILAGITIKILMNSGLIQKTNLARDTYTKVKDNEQKELNRAENLINNFEGINLLAELFYFTSTDSNWDVKNVKEALDYLYN